MKVSEAGRLTIFSPSFDRGGVERMLAQLARGLGDLGVAVDLVVNRRPPHFLDRLPSSVRVVELAALGDKPLKAPFVTCAASVPASCSVPRTSVTTPRQSRGLSFCEPPEAARRGL